MNVVERLGTFVPFLDPVPFIVMWCVQLVLDLLLHAQPLGLEQEPLEQERHETRVALLDLREDELKDLALFRHEVLLEMHLLFQKEVPEETSCTLALLSTRRCCSSTHSDGMTYIWSISVCPTSVNSKHWAFTSFNRPWIVSVWAKSRASSFSSAVPWSCCSTLICSSTSDATRWSICCFICAFASAVR